jgi:hypothetical protein
MHDMQGTAEARTAEEGAITATVLDYYWGWFEADADRMERAIHHELAKRSPLAGPNRLDQDSAADMIAATAKGQGKERLAQVGDPRLEVEVVDVHGSIANVTVRCALYYEYLHLMRTPDGWKIVNAIWDRP